MRRLTDARYWEEHAWKGRRPERLWRYRDVDFETVALLGSNLRGRGGRILELGGGASRVLPYVARKFGCRAFGADFSIVGCLLLRANLALKGADGGVVCEDLFQSSLPEGGFDLVYSSGLVEHFDDPRAALAEHVRLAAPGASIVAIVPNLEGFQGRIIRRLAPPLWDVHLSLRPRDLARMFESLGLESVTSGYLGSFLIRIRADDEWTAVRRWPRPLQTVLPPAVRVANGLVCLAFRLLPWRPHWRALSAACFAAGRKPTKPRCQATASS